MSTGSEKNTITSVVPAGALDYELGIVSSVYGCADANGIDANEIINNAIRIFCICSLDHR